MNKMTSTLLFLALLTSSLATAQDLTCSTGPVHKVFAGNTWLIYSCADEASLFLVTAEDNPAAPHYFTLSPEGDGYRLYGEGKTNQPATEPVAEYLRQLSDAEILALLAATKNVVPDSH